MDIDEKHMDLELEYILQNPEISKKSYDNYSLKQIKYTRILLDYIKILKEKAKTKEINDNEIKIYLTENEDKNTEFSNIMNREDLELILNEINNKDNKDNEDININDEILKELENKSLKELLKEIYGNNLIDIKELINIFNERKYNKIFYNTFKIFQSLEKENILTISQEELITKISLDEIIINEFKDYLLLTKYKKYMKKYNSNKSLIPSLLNFLNNKKYDSFTISKKIELQQEKKIKNIIMINDIIAVLDEDNIKIYSYKFAELTQTLENKFDNMILNNKKTEIIAKLDLSNYAIFIDCSTLNEKKYFFANSNGKKLGIQTSDEKIIMSGSYEIYLYSKYKDIYILEKIINFENPLNIYQFDTNSIVIIAGKQTNNLYQYSTNGYNLIKYKTNFNGELVKINNNIIISYTSDHFNNSFINLLHSKTFKVLFCFKIKGKINSIKYIEDNTILIGTDIQLYSFHISSNNIVILDKIFEGSDYSYIDYINYIDEDTIILGSFLFGRIYYFQKSK